MWHFPKKLLLKYFRAKFNFLYSSQISKIPETTKRRKIILLKIISLNSIRKIFSSIIFIIQSQPCHLSLSSGNILILNFCRTDKFQSEIQFIWKFMRVKCVHSKIQIWEGNDQCKGYYEVEAFYNGAKNISAHNDGRKLCCRPHLNFFEFLLRAIEGERMCQVQ